MSYRYTVQFSILHVSSQGTHQFFKFFCVFYLHGVFIKNMCKSSEHVACSVQSLLCFVHALSLLAFIFQKFVALCFLLLFACCMYAAIIFVKFIRSTPSLESSRKGDERCERLTAPAPQPKARTTNNFMSFNEMWLLPSMANLRKPFFKNNWCLHNDNPTLLSNRSEMMLNACEVLLSMTG